MVYPQRYSLARSFSDFASLCWSKIIDSLNILCSYGRSCTQALKALTVAGSWPITKISTYSSKAFRNLRSAVRYFDFDIYFSFQANQKISLQTVAGFVFLKCVELPWSWRLNLDVQASDRKRNGYLLFCKSQLEIFYFYPSNSPESGFCLNGGHLFFIVVFPARPDNISQWVMQKKNLVG